MATLDNPFIPNLTIFLFFVLFCFVLFCVFVDWMTSNIKMSDFSGGHVHARGSILKPVEPRSHLAAPGVCTTMAASLPGAKTQENSNY